MLYLESLAIQPKKIEIDMKKRSSSFINMFVTLAVVTLAASASLGFVYQLTKEPIAKAQLEKQKKAINEVLPGFDNDPIAAQFKLPIPESSDSLLFYPVIKGEQVLGHAIKTYSSKGYSGDIWIMLGMDQQGKVTQYAVLEHKETPGLGSKISAEQFREQFIGLLDEPEVTKDGGRIDAISGATISSRAVCEAIVKAQATWQQLADNN